MTLGLLDECDAQLTAVARLEVEAAQLYVRQSEALLDLWDTAPADSRVGGTAHIVAEAASLLHLHPSTIDGRLAVAMTLRDHPLLPSLMRDGRLGIAHALAAVDEVRALGDPELADRVLQEVLVSGGRLGWDRTPADLRRALRRTAVRLDPAAAQRRRQEEVERRTGIRLRPLPDGLASLTATGGAPQITATDRLLDVLSRPAGPDDTRSRGQRQLDALLAALVARAGTAVDMELQIGIPVKVTDTAPVSGCAPEPMALELDLTPDLLAVLSAPSLGARRPPAEPAEAAEVVPADPELADPDPDVAELAAVESSTAAAVTSPPTTSPHGPLRGLGRRQGVAELVGNGPVDPALLGELLNDPHGLPIGLGRLQLRRICTDPTGQVVAVDARAIPLADLLHPAATPQTMLRQLTRALPPPPPATASYTPTAAQSRVVCARDTSCTFPGCARRARRCELDHRKRYRDGGPTSVVNLHPLCKHHHRLKHDGWTCARNADGTTTWTSPRGQRLRC